MPDVFRGYRKRSWHEIGQVEIQDSLHQAKFPINHMKMVRMNSTCFKTLKVQNLCKIFGERCETGPLYGVIFQSSSKPF